MDAVTTTTNVLTNEDRMQIINTFFREFLTPDAPRFQQATIGIKQVFAFNYDPDFVMTDADGELMFENNAKNQLIAKVQLYLKKSVAIAPNMDEFDYSTVVLTQSTIDELNKLISELYHDSNVNPRKRVSMKKMREIIIDNFVYQPNYVNSDGINLSHPFDQAADQLKLLLTVVQKKEKKTVTKSTKSDDIVIEKQSAVINDLYVLDVVYDLTELTVAND